MNYPKEVRINICQTCHAIYTESKTAHCKEKNCTRDNQAIFTCNGTLFWSRISLALETNVPRDIYGTVKKAGKRSAPPVVESVEVANPKKLTGSIHE